MRVDHADNGLARIALVVELRRHRIGGSTFEVYILDSRTGTNR